MGQIRGLVIFVAQKKNHWPKTVKKSFDVVDNTFRVEVPPDHVQTRHLIAVFRRTTRGITMAAQHDENERLSVSTHLDEYGRFRESCHSLTCVAEDHIQAASGFLSAKEWLSWRSEGSQLAEQRRRQTY